MSELTISIRDLKRLVEPVIPFASTDVQLPVLNCIRVESRGTHLIALATDRFRLGFQRVAAPEGGTWPEWSATIPLATLRSLFQTYKAQRFSEPVITLRLDGDALSVHGDQALVDLLDASVTYPLSDGQFPNVRSIIRKAIAVGDDESAGSTCGVNQKLLADFARASKAPALHMRVNGTREPILFADGEDFIGILMPRRALGGADDAGSFPAFDSWADLLSDEAKAPKAKRSRKAVAS